MDEIMSFTIKKLSPNDIGSAKELFLFFQIDDGVENPGSASDKYLKKFLSRDDFHVIVAVEDEKVIGGLTAYELVKYKREETEMFLYEIAVDKSHRRKVIASGLIECLREICISKGITEMFVATEMNNTPAKKLYESTGGEFEATAIYTYKLV